MERLEKGLGSAPGYLDCLARENLDGVSQSSGLGIDHKAKSGKVRLDVQVPDSMLKSQLENLIDHGARFGHSNGGGDVHDPVASRSALAKAAYSLEYATWKGSLE